MHPPIRIVEESRIMVSRQMLDGKHVCNTAYFLVYFSNSEKEHRLIINTDPEYSHALSFSLDYDRWISDREMPAWVMTVLDTFNRAGEYNDAESRELRLKSSWRAGIYHYEISSPPRSPMAVSQARFFSPVPVVCGADFSIGVDVSPETRLSHYTS